MNTSTLKQLTAEVVAQADQLDERVRELALAAEQLSQDAAVQAAYQQGIEQERWRVLTLISIQQNQLSRGGTNAMVLAALRRQVREVQP
jgi:hypothetical protein